MRAFNFVLSCALGAVSVIALALTDSLIVQLSSFSPHVFYLAFVMIYVADNINININDIARVYLYLHGETHGIVMLMHKTNTLIQYN